MMSSRPGRRRCGRAGDDVVGAGAADDALGVEAETLADSRPQGRCRAVRVAVRVGGTGGDRGGDAWRRAEGAFVRGELDHLHAAGELGLAGGVGVDLEDLGTRAEGHAGGLSGSRQGKEDRPAF